MSGALVVPDVVAASAGIVAGVIRWPVRPMLAVRLLTTVAVVVSVTMAAVLALVTISARCPNDQARTRNRRSKA